MLKKVYVWELPVRLTHWLNFLTIIVLCFTGYFISRPFTNEPQGDFLLMSTMRFIHFVSAYVFTISFFLRIYWAFVGNQYAQWGEFVPLTRKVWREILGDMKFYLFLQKEHAHRTGHHALASFTYLGMFFLFHLMIVTGFALLSEFHYGFVWKVLGGWLVPFVSFQTLRLIHHLMMWLFIAFAILHVYAGWFIASIEKNAIMDSIFSGYKVVDE